MTVLRIFFDAPPSGTRAFAWALFDAQGTCVREGRDPAEHWPRSTRREAVLAADLAPLLAFKLPPLSASRLDGAVRLQLEDRLATPLSTQRVIVSPQQRDGWVRVLLIEHTLPEALRRFGIDRAFSETELMDTATDAWHWCVSPEGRGFMRRDRHSGGGAFALDLSSAASREVPPTELMLALAAETAPPKTLYIHAALPSETLSSWQRASGIGRLIIEPPWRWAHADPALYARATELLPSLEPASPPHASAAGWRTAAALVGIALGLHVVATAATWGSALWQHWQISRGWQALAAEAGLSEKAAAIPPQWSRVYAEARHRAGLPAPDDALPLLARAAPSLQTLPPGALRNAVYADRAWTFECTPLDAAVQKSLETGLRRTGLQTMSGNTAAGYRLRVQTQTYAP
ncbi:MAG: hypothetical protein LBE75_06945 [Burkholderiales bacterium]|jgi:hypothetical protein|nr:hypothetical protein [Burkholderiales bacterium]